MDCFWVILVIQKACTILRGAVSEADGLCMAWQRYY
jgi:hypothetical protein